MKKIMMYSVALAGCLLASTAFAQYPENFTKDQADSTMKARNAEIATMQSELKSTQDAIAKANTDLQQRMADNDNCRTSLYALCGSDRNGYNAYRERLARDEQELSTLRSMSPAMLGQNKARVDALENEIRSLRGDKLVLIPDHKQRVMVASNSFMQMKKGMIPPEKMYTVGTWQKDRDCLWNIAKKPDIYNDPFAWPKIWHNNQDQIKNPDLIYPGQQLKISETPITEQDKDLTGYRHRKH
jgi:nucleoid-associated protein YgaU